MAQQILKEVDRSFKSFFALLKFAKKGQYDNKKIKLPKYLDKDGFTTLVIGFVRLKDDRLIIPYSNSFKKTHEEIAIKLLSVLKGKKIKEIIIIPKQHSRFFEIQYTYEIEEIQRELNKENGLGIDLGINNLCICVTNNGVLFIIDGRKLKSINQYYNKINAKLQSIKDKQKIERTTSKASFFDGDIIPVYDKEKPQEYKFSGKRIKRGLYQTSKGKLINADCNGTLNILRKSKVADLTVLYNRGELNMSKRIRVV